MAFVDFKKLKAELTIEQVARYLGLALKRQGQTIRGQCPVNQGDDRELVITPAKQAAYCFGCREGGDLIFLAAHAKQLGLRDAALELKKHLVDIGVRDVNRPAAPPKAPETRQEAPRATKEGFKGLDYLEHEHEAVQALGIPAEVAQALGIGYAKRGTMVKRVLIPLRSDTGKLVGYIGVAPGADVKLPKTFHLPAD
jgi:DNA primase